jgi:hypothetical protein
LTPRDTLVSAVRRQLRPGVSVLIAGGEAAVSQAVEEEIRATGARVDRVGGRDRYETALLLADRLRSQRGVPVYLASGVSPTDALAAAPVAAREGAGLLLVDPAGLSATPAVAGWLANHAHRAILVGGTAAIPETFDVAVQQTLFNLTPSRTSFQAFPRGSNQFEEPFTVSPLGGESFLTFDGEARTVEFVLEAVDEPVVLAGRFGGLVLGGEGDMLPLIGPGCAVLRPPGAARGTVECEEVVLELGDEPVSVPVTIERRVAAVGLDAFSVGEYTLDIRLRVADQGVPPPEAPQLDVSLLVVLEPP